VSYASGNPKGTSDTPHNSKPLKTVPFAQRHQGEDAGKAMQRRCWVSGTGPVQPDLADGVNRSAVRNATWHRARHLDQNRRDPWATDLGRLGPKLVVAF